MRARQRLALGGRPEKGCASKFDDESRAVRAFESTKTNKTQRTRRRMGDVEVEGDVDVDADPPVLILAT